MPQRLDDFLAPKPQGQRLENWTVGSADSPAIPPPPTPEPINPGNPNQPSGRQSLLSRGVNQGYGTFVNTVAAHPLATIEAGLQTPDTTQAQIDPFGKRIGEIAGSDHSDFVKSLLAGLETYKAGNAAIAPGQEAIAKGFGVETPAPAQGTEERIADATGHTAGFLAAMAAGGQFAPEAAMAQAPAITNTATASILGALGGENAPGETAGQVGAFGGIQALPLPTYVKLPLEMAASAGIAGASGGDTTDVMIGGMMPLGFHGIEAAKKSLLPAAPATEATPAAPTPQELPVTQAETSPQSTGAAYDKFADIKDMEAKASAMIAQDAVQKQKPSIFSKLLTDESGGMQFPPKNKAEFDAMDAEAGKALEENQTLAQKGRGIIDLLKGKVKEVATEESGGVPVDKIKEKAKAVGEHLMDSARRLSGHMFPSITRAARGSGEAAARFVASRNYVSEQAPLVAEQTMGTKGIKPELDLKLGTALTQDSLDGIREGFQKQAADAAAAGDLDTALAAHQKAMEVKDVIGPDAPIKDRAEYDALSSDPAFMEMVKRHDDWFQGEPTENYKTAQGLDPSVTLAPRGPKFGTRINLMHLEEGAGETKARGLGRGNLHNPLEKKSGFASQAQGTGENYELRYSELVKNTLGKDTEIANQHRLNDQLVKDGLAKRGKPGEKVEIDGQPTVPFSLKDRTIVIPGKATVPQNEVLYVRKDAASEYRQALNVDSPEYSKLLTTASKAANTAALQSISEGAYHVGNQLSALVNTPGTGFVFPSMIKRGLDLWRNDASTRSQLAELARIGATKEPHATPKTLLGKLNPLTWTGKAISFTDRVGRLVMDDAFTKLAKKNLVENNETERRNLVNKFGQYNKRAQHKLVALARDTGIGPFATAGTRFYAGGMEALQMSPGIKGKSPAAEAHLRGAVLVRYASILASVGLANYLKWGRMDGGNNVPIGAYRLDDDPKTGKVRYFDLVGMTAIGRGLRQIGARDVIEGIHQGDQPATYLDKAAKTAALSPLHPFEGPLVNDVVTAATGYNPGGYREAKKAPQGESQAFQNVKAAALNANPIMGAVTADEPDITEELGRFRVKTGKREESKAMIQARKLAAGVEQPMTREEMDRKDARKSLLEAYKEPGANKFTVAAEARKAKVLPNEQIVDTMKKATTPETLSSLVKDGGLAPEQLMHVFDVATPEERQKIVWILREKISASEDSPEKKQEYRKRLREGMKK